MVRNGYISADKEIAGIRGDKRMGYSMHIRNYKLREGKLPVITIFTAGIVAGILFMNLGKSILLESTGLLDEYALYQMKYMTVDSKALFYYVLKERFAGLLLLAIMSTTYLGLVVCAGATFWYGMCAGMFLATSVIRYGIKGLLLVMVGIFPQYLVYVPAMLGLLLWCQRLYQIIYLDKTYIAKRQDVSFLSRQLLRLAGISALFILGCILESFMNPALMKGLLKIF